MFHKNTEDAKAHLDNHHKGEPIVMIVWTRDDIVARLKDRGVIVNLTDAQLTTALKRIADAHDANYGITWDSIDSVMDDIADDVGQG